MQPPRQCLGHDDHTCDKMVSGRNVLRCAKCGKARRKEQVVIYLKAKTAEEKKKAEEKLAEGMGSYKRLDEGAFVSLDGVLKNN